MSKTVMSEINGFTLVPDVLVKRYGMMTAAVFGMVWRYCQMKEGVCRASLERIAAELKIHRNSVIHHIHILVSNGYLQDTTPDLRNRPHIYADTGKVASDSRMGTVEKGVPEWDSKAPDGAQVIGSAAQETDSKAQDGAQEMGNTAQEMGSTAQEMDSHSTTDVLEDSIKIPVKKPLKITTTTTTTSGAIFRIYEQEIGPLTPIISEEIGGYLDDPKCPPGYVADAIHEAARQNKRSWAYVRAILNRWSAEGKRARDKPRAGPKDADPYRTVYKPYVDPLEGQYVID